jgi:hypothetical protein
VIPALDLDTDADVLPRSVIEAPSPPRPDDQRRRTIRLWNNLLDPAT